MPADDRDDLDPYDSHDVRGLPCQWCGQTMRYVYTLAEHGAYCSDHCRQIVREAAEQRAARKDVA